MTENLAHTDEMESIDVLPIYSHFFYPFLIILTGGVPVFDLISKVILGALLLPVENIASKLLDKFSAFINKNKKINQKVRNS